jgi:hypothetical protein
MGFRNLGAWTNTLKGKVRSVHSFQDKLAKATAFTAIAEIRTRLPGGTHSLFEGYASTGELSQALQAVKQREPGQYKVTIKGPPFVMMKAMVHENGVVITGRPGHPLRFQIKGKWVTTYRVVIRKKQWFSGGWLASISKPLQKDIRLEW